MKRIEYRHYRPTWSAGAGWQVGQECFFVDAYYRLEEGNGTSSPDMEGNGWRRLGMEEVAAVIAFDQPWEATQMDPAGVDTDAFAYREDPKYNPAAKPIGPCSADVIGSLFFVCGMDPVYHLTADLSIRAGKAGREPADCFSRPDVL